MIPAWMLQEQATITADTSVPAVVRTPLPGGVGAFVRVIFNQPPWLQKTAIAAAGVIAMAVIVWLWLRRARVVAWLRGRSRIWKLALAAVAVLMVTGFAGFSAVAWHYTQHNNDFCIGCHVMGDAWTKFQHSEHRKLECHDCHRQSIFASMRQLYLWVAERPSEIPPHARVPTRICQECHNQQQADSSWKRIITTAGHALHLRNDTLPLRDVQCVTCHGAEIHHFVPVDKTCGQSGCHENVPIQLGKMAGQTSLHCTGCHSFTAEVAENISPDSVRRSLVPSGANCLECHAMKERMRETLAELDPTREPHQAVCGSCHDPHEQRTPRAAFATCTEAGCHARPDTLTPFHRGLARGALQNCASCHPAHSWKVKSRDCLACHGELGGTRPRTPARHTASFAPPSRPPGGPNAAEAPPNAESAPSRGPAVSVTSPNDTTFSHARHKGVACSACHSARREHGEVTIRRPAGCLACHHAADQRLECTQCHTQGELPSRSITTTVATSVRRSPIERSLPFTHDEHARVRCRSCHTGGPRLAVEKTCASCHGEHHRAEATCATCHPGAPGLRTTIHPREQTHAGCGGAGCHEDAAVNALPASRSICLSCHVEQTKHKPDGDCATCHLVRWTANDGGGAGSRGGRQ